MNLNEYKNIKKRNIYIHIFMCIGINIYPFLYFCIIIIYYIIQIIFIYIYTKHALVNGNQYKT